MTPTEEKLVQVLVTGLRIDPARRVDAETPIFGAHGLGLDSVDVLEIAVLLDKHFDLVIEEANPQVREALTTIGALAAYIDAQRR